MASDSLARHKCVSNDKYSKHSEKKGFNAAQQQLQNMAANKKKTETQEMAESKDIIKIACLSLIRALRIYFVCFFIFKYR